MFFVATVYTSPISDSPSISGANITSGTIPNASLANGAVANLSGTNTGDISLASIGSSPANAGASLSGQVLTLQPADGTHPGLISNGTQTIPGVKTFSSAMVTQAIPQRDNATGLTAAGNDSQGSCTALTHEINVFSTVGASTNTACLPAASVAGQHAMIINYGANTLHIFPFSGQTINSQSANTEWLAGVATTTGGTLGSLDCSSSSSSDWSCK